MIIPPSILMIVWGGVLTVSIGALFLAGIIPGLLIGLAQMATVHVYAKRRGYPTYPRATLERSSSRDRWIVDPGADDAGHHHRRQDLRLVHRDRVGLHRGALCRRAVAVRLSRDGPARGSDGALLDTGKLAGVALFCVGTASAFGWLLAYYQIPKALLAGVAAWGMGSIATGFFIAVVFLVVGCFLDAIPGDHHRRHHPASRWPQRGRTWTRCTSP